MYITLVVNATNMIHMPEEQGEGKKEKKKKKKRLD